MRGSLGIAAGLAVASIALSQTALADSVDGPEPCAIRSEAASIKSVKVQPAGESSFLIALARVPVEASPMSSRIARLKVQSPLRFTTEHPLNQLRVVTAKRVSLKGGRLILGRGQRPTFLAPADHDPKRSDALMSLPLRDLAPEQPLAIPCSALTIPGEVPTYSDAPDLASSTKRILHATSSAVFPLYAKRKAEDPWRIKFHGPLTVVRRSGTWVKLQAKWDDGSVLRGWSNSKDLIIMDAVPAIGVEASGIGGIGHCGRSHHRRPVSYVLKANAPVHTKAKGAIWAHTAGVIKVMAFPLSRSDGWLQIASIDGMPPPSCSDHSKFWVHAESIQWTDTPI